MRAAIYQGPESIEIAEVPEPTCGSDSLVLRVEACGLCGSDVRTFFKGTSYVPQGTIMGHEASGVVEAVGPEVQGFKAGDRLVVGPVIPCGECYFCKRGAQHLCAFEESFAGTLPGGFAEYMLVTGRALRWGSVGFVPADLSMEEASLAEPLSSVVKTHEQLNTTEGNTIVVIGAGPVGCMHVELARMRGAAKVIQTDLSPERIKSAATFGANVLIDANAEDSVARIQAETEGRGADIVICAASSAEVAGQAIRMVSPGGKVCWFAGLPSGKPEVQVDGNLVHYKEIAIIGAIGFAPRHFHRALHLIAARKIDARRYITGAIPLEGIADGIRKLKSGQALKLIVLPRQ